MLLPNDILTYTTSDGVTVWVSQRLVMECCGVGGQLLKLSRVRYKASLPASWQKKAEASEFLLDYKAGKSWRWGRKNGQYYYDVDTIPNRKPTCYRDCLPSKEELIELVEEQRLRGSRERQAQLAKLITQAAQEFCNEEDVRWLHSVSEINIATCRDYGRALGWCRLISMVDRNQNYLDFGIPTQQMFHDECAEILGRIKLANLRVTTGASLRKKLRGFPADLDEQRRWIISGKYGNVNRKIVGKYQIVDVITGEIKPFDIHQAVMYNAYMNVGDPRKEYKETLYNEVYVPMMEAFGIDPIAQRTFNSHLTRFSARLNADLHRHGGKYYRKQMQTYIPTAKLAYAHSLFCGDGSGLVGYRYWKKVGKNGKITEELRVMNVYAILISDVASGYITGYAFAPEGTSVETRQMVQHAVRMSVAGGGNQTMFEFVSDNHGAFTKAEQKEFLREVFNVVRTIEPDNSQGNPAETQFRLFKNSTLRSMKNFIRSSHNAKHIEGFANVENMVKEDYPEYREAIAQVIEAIDRWNNKPRGNGKTPAEMFAAKHPDCRPMEPIQLRNIFGHRTQVEVTRMRGFVIVEHAGINHQFTIPDYHDSGIRKISRATGNGYDATVDVRWDASGADLYSSDGKFILSCPPTVKASKAHAERSAEQLVAQRYLNSRKQDQWEHAQEFGRRVQDAYSTIASGNGYTADVQFGDRKEELNGWFEEELNASITDANTKRKLAQAKTKRKRAADLADRKEAKLREDATLAYRRSKVDLTKYGVK